MFYPIDYGDGSGYGDGYGDGYGYGYGPISPFRRIGPRVKGTEMKTVLVCSDTHIGDGGPRDDNRDHFEKFVQELCEALDDPNIHKVILLGDMADVWLHGEKAAQRMAYAICKAIKGRSERASKLVYARGNHDNGLRREHEGCSYLEYEYLEYDEFGIHFLHGNQLDPIPRLWSRVGKGLCKAAAWLGRISPTLEDTLSGFASKAITTGRFDDPGALNVAAARMAKSHGYRAIVCGHSHRPFDGMIDGIRVINSGYYPRDRWLRLTMDGDTIRVDREWRKVGVPCSR